MMTRQVSDMMSQCRLFADDTMESLDVKSGLWIVSVLGGCIFKALFCTQADGSSIRDLLSYRIDGMMLVKPSFPHMHPPMIAALAGSFGHQCGHASVPFEANRRLTWSRRHW
jgi:hypothetical protein